MSLEIRYLDSPPGIREATQITLSECSGVSSASKLMEDAAQSLWATLETGGWPLDGSRQLMDGQSSVGVWSQEYGGIRSAFLGAGQLGQMAIADEICELLTPPRICLSLSERFSAPGVTLTFSPETGQWCSRIRLEWYQGDTLLCRREEQPGQCRFVVQQPVEQFDRVELTLLETPKPGWLGKLQSIELGQMLVFSAGELQSVSLTSEADPTLSQLTVDTVTVQLWDQQDRDLHPKKDQMLELCRDGSLVAAYSITKCTRNGLRQYALTAQSRIGLLEDTFLGGIYENIPVTNLLAQILGDIPWQMEESLGEMTVSGYLPVCTRREALQQLAFSLGALVSTRGSRGISLSRIPQQISGKFTADKLFQNGSVETAPPVGRIQVTAHSYTPSGDPQTLVDGEYYSGQDMLLTFSSPHWDYAITGGTLKETGANHIVFSADGEVTVTARPYLHTTVRYSRGGKTAGSNQQQKTVENATLVHSGNVAQVLDRLEEASGMCHTLQQEVVLDNQHPGQKVAVELPWGGMLQGYISAMQAHLTPAGQTARITVLGTYGGEGELQYAGWLYAGREGVLL